MCVTPSGSSTTLVPSHLAFAVNSVQRSLISTSCEKKEEKVLSKQTCHDGTGKMTKGADLKVRVRSDTSPSGEHLNILVALFCLGEARTLTHNHSTSTV